jgi:hypothetical protein
VNAEEIRGEMFWLRAELMETAEKARKFGNHLDRVADRLAALRQEISGAMEDTTQANLFKF